MVLPAAKDVQQDNAEQLQRQRQQVPPSDDAEVPQQPAQRQQLQGLRQGQLQQTSLSAKGAQMEVVTAEGAMVLENSTAVLDPIQALLAPEVDLAVLSVPQPAAGQEQPNVLAIQNTELRAASREQCTEPGWQQCMPRWHGRLPSLMTEQVAASPAATRLAPPATAVVHRSMPGPASPPCSLPPGLATFLMEPSNLQGVPETLLDAPSLVPPASAAMLPATQVTKEVALAAAPTLPVLPCGAAAADGPGAAPAVEQVEGLEAFDVQIDAPCTGA